MKRKWMIVLLCLSMVLLIGCNGIASQNNDDVWVIAEEVTYDEAGDVTNRKVYTYEGSERNYQIRQYNGDGQELAYTDVVLTKDGTRRTETMHLNANAEYVVQYDYEYDMDGKLLHKRTILDKRCDEQSYRWNDDGTVAEIWKNDVYQYTDAYDTQGRIIRSYNDEYETVYTYTETEKVMRTSYIGVSGVSRVEYVVHKYDETGREVELLNYELEEDRPYTDDDIVGQTTFVYAEDGHSYTVQYMIDNEDVQTSGSIHYIYKPLSELLED